MKFLSEEELQVQHDKMKAELGAICAPFANFKTSSLAGYVSFFYYVSLQNREEWANQIFHNSPNGIFSIKEIAGKFIVELVETHSCAKFRKSTCKTPADAGAKINKWIDESREIIKLKS